MQEANSETRPCLLAVDVGLRLGYAFIDTAGSPFRYGSRHFGNREHLRRGVAWLIGLEPHLQWLALEGGGPLADIWENHARKLGIPVLRTTAEQWREALLRGRDCRDAGAAKATALVLARGVIAETGRSRAKSLRHDAAEAVLAGIWAAREIGWIVGSSPFPLPGSRSGRHQR